jgi:zinc D-Ala-D-Ala carboxypeptidase
MAHRRGARATARRVRARRIRAAGVLIALVGIGVLGQQLLSSSSSRAAPPIHTLPDEPPRRVGEARDDRGRALGEADGAVPRGTTVFDVEVPGVANLNPAILDSLRRAATDAAASGVELVVDSGWRSPAYQGRLLREAVSKYGSEQEAARWVATPDTSAHVSGDAVDIGPSRAAAWLSDHGFAYGLCQTYANEPWHFEVRLEAVGRGCPPMYADAAHDPRMQS